MAVTVGKDEIAHIYIICLIKTLRMKLVLLNNVVHTLNSDGNHVIDVIMHKFMMSNSTE